MEISDQYATISITEEDRAETLILPAGMVSEGLVCDAAALRAVIEAERKALTVREAAVVIHCPKTILRFITLPVMKERQLENALAYAFERIFPISREEVVFGWKKCGMTDGRLAFAIAALPKEVPESYVILFQSLGIELVCLDVAESAVAEGFGLCDKGSVLLVYKKDGSIVVTHMRQGYMKSLWKTSIDENNGRMEMKRSLLHHIPLGLGAQMEAVPRFCALTSLPDWVEDFFIDAGISRLAADQTFSELVLNGMRERMRPRRKEKKRT